MIIEKMRWKKKMKIVFQCDRVIPKKKNMKKQIYTRRRTDSTEKKEKQSKVDFSTLGPSVYKFDRTWWALKLTDSEQPGPRQQQRRQQRRPGRRGPLGTQFHWSPCWPPRSCRLSGCHLNNGQREERKNLWLGMPFSFFFFQVTGGWTIPLLVILILAPGRPMGVMRMLRLTSSSSMIRLVVGAPSWMSDSSLMRMEDWFERSSWLS